MLGEVARLLILDVTGGNYFLYITVQGRFGDATGITSKC